VTVAEARAAGLPLKRCAVATCGRLRPRLWHLVTRREDGHFVSRSEFGCCLGCIDSDDAANAAVSLTIPGSTMFGEGLVMRWERDALEGI
jgi:hypothetical protein